MTFPDWIKRQMGFEENTQYQKRYINDSNIRTAFYMSFIVLALELWMIIRYVQQRPGRTFLEYFDGETNYLILFLASLIIASFSFEYTREYETYTLGRIISVSVIALDVIMTARYFIVNSSNTGFGTMLLGAKYHICLMILAVLYMLRWSFSKLEKYREDRYGQVLLTVYCFICIGFGILTSIYDVGKDRQILCFVTMLLFVACMLIWKPYVSTLVLGVAFLYFYALWSKHLHMIDPGDGSLINADRINYFICWIALVMVSTSLYHQRRQEAEKDEGYIKANDNLSRIAIEDEMTGIHNIFHFNQEAAYVLKDSHSVKEKIFLFLNIENFKTYNDQIGYQAGNEYLKKIAHLVQDTFEGDTVARLSDDHFVVLTDASVAESKTEIIRDVIHQTASGVYMELKVGAYRPVDRDLDPRIAIDYARYACGLTKNKFNFNYKEYDADVDQKFHERQYIVNNIDNAINNGYIRPYYQPVVWADSRQFCGSEALARWIDPTYGFLSPAEFIPVLEDNRQIHKLDEYILKCVCKDFRDGLNKGLPIAPVSINFSRLDFELMDVPTKLEEITHEYGISREYIHVEITESALAGDDGLVSDAIDKLHGFGYSVWLDDFGSGYSSLNVLKDYQFDMMKIDMKFLDGFNMDNDAPVILDTIIKLADNLKMMSLTEGVETAEIADFLTKAGCGRLQGYFFAKPMPLQEFREAITNNPNIVTAV
ncbi:MAG: bifunctional diguanylate cyclase/phosphodiesterase [Lachnospiraceae bacterium]|nr:bifunctional diguanylate cyclase/phosphodiesterase [Lachnospiraceae bacterium]